MGRFSTILTAVCRYAALFFGGVAVVEAMVIAAVNQGALWLVALGALASYGVVVWQALKGEEKPQEFGWWRFVTGAIQAVIRFSGASLFKAVVSALAALLLALVLLPWILPILCPPPPPPVNRTLTVQLCRGNCGPGAYVGNAMLYLQPVAVDAVAPPAGEAPLAKTTDARGIVKFETVAPSGADLWVEEDLGDTLRTTRLPPTTILRLPDFIHVSILVPDDSITTAPKAAHPVVAAQRPAFMLQAVRIDLRQVAADDRTVGTIDPAARANIARFGLPRAEVLVQHSAFLAGFSPFLRTSRWVAYQIRLGDSPRVRGKFLLDPTVAAQMQVAPSGYVGSGYDRGHMISPSDIKFDQTALNEVSYMTVVAPQTRILNEIVWAHLEQYARKFAAGGDEILVFAGPVYADANGRQPKTLIRIPASPPGVAVPTHFFRILVRASPTGGTEVLAFLIPNADQIDKDFSHYLTSVQRIQDVTGLSFLTALQPKVRGVLIAKAAAALWPVPEKPAPVEPPVKPPVLSPDRPIDRVPIRPLPSQP
ncbi:MAG: DNA/RNA non-specific endonuclease [Rhizomicrobium sp.]